MNRRKFGRLDIVLGFRDRPSRRTGPCPFAPGRSNNQKLMDGYPSG
jgi:hypothetical protein